MPPKRQSKKKSDPALFDSIDEDLLSNAVDEAIENNGLASKKRKLATDITTKTKPKKVPTVEYAKSDTEDKDDDESMVTQEETMFFDKNLFFYFTFPTKGGIIRVCSKKQEGQGFDLSVKSAYLMVTDHFLDHVINDIIKTEKQEIDPVPQIQQLPFEKIEEYQKNITYFLEARVLNTKKMVMLIKTKVMNRSDNTKTPIQIRSTKILLPYLDIAILNSLLGAAVVRAITPNLDSVHAGLKLYAELNYLMETALKEQDLQSVQDIVKCFQKDNDSFPRSLTAVIQDRPVVEAIECLDRNLMGNPRRFLSGILFHSLIACSHFVFNLGHLPEKASVKKLLNSSYPKFGHFALDIDGKEFKLVDYHQLDKITPTKITSAAVLEKEQQQPTMSSLEKDQGKDADNDSIKLVYEDSQSMTPEFQRMPDTPPASSPELLASPPCGQPLSMYAISVLLSSP